METTRLIEALSDPSAYPSPGEQPEVRQTHISIVFLAGPHAYKVKKPVEMGFLDFSTLEKRRRFCEEEVRLNCRMAPDVYLGVVPVVRKGEGLAVEGAGEPVEWAVKMRRLPDEATLESRLRRGEADEAMVCALARRIATFHASAESGEHISSFGRFGTVARNARENLEQAASLAGVTVAVPVLERLRVLTEAILARLQPLIEERAARGVPRDTHGDLRLEHVYLFPGQSPPADLAVIDCIEFNERFRFADPVADMAFLAMDLKAHGRRDLAAAFADEYFLASGDKEGRGLLPFYTAYRAAVRAKVEGFKLGETEIPEGQRRAAQNTARAHWLLALGELEAPGQRPCLALAAGLPGTGKSTLARGLAAKGGFQVVRSDLVRKELAGVAGSAAPADFDGGLYTREWTERTYAECLRRAEAVLADGGRVAVDASFGEERRRGDFLALAARMGVPAAYFACEAEPEVVKARLASRTGDASDADWSVYEKAAARWEPSGEEAGRVLCRIRAGGAPEPALEEALERLRHVGLA